MSYKRSRANYEADHQPPFALFGTPLPPLDSEARDDGSYVPLWKQEVRDDRGRKRLHGAFTGGFSAGYFNTVGSKEGWTPSTFVSSRTNRAKDAKTISDQKAEDFMDDEDLADAAEAQKLETQGSFAGLGSTQEDGARRGLFNDLFKATGDTMGVKLLQKMGWRQGQGVGPKVLRKASLGETDSTDQAAHLFAPVNTRVVTINRKKDRFGLGYAAEERLDGGNFKQSSSLQRYREEEEDEDDEGLFSLKRTQKQKPKSKKGAFGAGVLNDDGSDDEDPYEMGPKISYNRIIGGDRKKKKGGIIANTANPVAKTAPTFMSRRLGKVISNTGFRKCFDGRLPLGGFVLASSPLITDQENKYPPPVVPEGWEPAKSKDSTKPVDQSAFKSTADAARESTMDPAARAVVLGEQQLPGKSIFDYMSKEARERLVSATGKTNLPQARGEAAPAGFERSEAQKQKSLWDLVPRLDSAVAAGSLQRGVSGWMPYGEDEAKRSRYRAFLEVSAGTRDSLPERAKGASTDEWVNEMNEFAQAAQVFKPISGLMASRFTSGSSAPKLASDHDPSATSTSSKREDPAEEAAKIGMFGPMTRSRVDFYPTRLLCKRFGVKAPAHADPGKGGSAGHDEQGQSGSGSGSGRLDLVPQASINQMMMEASRLKSQTQTQSATGGGLADTGSELPQVLKVQTVDPEVNTALEGQRAGEDVFKAIFGDDSDDE